VLALNAAGKASELQTVDVAGPAKRAGLPLSFYVQGMTTYVMA
jgi:hypothetical protein